MEERDEEDEQEKRGKVLEEGVNSVGHKRKKASRIYEVVGIEASYWWRILWLNFSQPPSFFVLPCATFCGLCG